MKKYLFVTLRFLFFLGIGIFFIWLFLRNLSHTQKKEIIEALKLANYSWIIVAILLGFLSHWIRALRWKILIEPLGYKPKNLNVFMAVMIGYLANLALPRLGEVSRCGILTQYERIPFNKSFGTVITERAIDLLAFIFLFLLMIFTMSSELSYYVDEKIYSPLINKFNIEPSTNTLIWFLITISIIILVFISFHKVIGKTKFYGKIQKMISGFGSGIQTLVKIRKPFAFISYTVLIWTLYLLMAYVVFFSLPETSSLSLEAGLAVLVFGSIGIMIVQGGIGIYPAIVAETLFLFSVASTTGYAMGWLIWSSQTIMIIIAGVISLLLLNTYNQKKYDDIRMDREKDTGSARIEESTEPVA